MLYEFVKKTIPQPIILWQKTKIMTEAAYKY